jgi:phosphodiesterase/alkaline phosphatase D-like protein
MINDRIMRLSTWVVLVLALVAALPARPSCAQAGSSPLPIARLEPFAYGVAAGDLTSDSVVLWTRTPGAASVTAELAASKTFENLTACPPCRPLLPPITRSVVATGCNLAHSITHFKVGCESAGTFKTPYAADQDAAVTFAFSGDADWKWKPHRCSQPDSRKLDFFVPADLIYETTDLKANLRRRSGGYRWKYRETANRGLESANGLNQCRPVRSVRPVFDLRQP